MKYVRDTREEIADMGKELERYQDEVGTVSSAFVSNEAEVYRLDSYIK